jgi:hypothetical protein
MNSERKQSARRKRRRRRQRAFRARTPVRLLEFIGPEQWALIRRISTDMCGFEYEVLGLSEPSVPSMLLGANISTLLWERHGPEAQWGDLEVDVLLDRCSTLPAEIQVLLFTMLLSLVTWLTHNGRLRPPRAQAMLTRLSLREPPEVTEMRKAVAKLPDAEHTRMEHRRLERVAEMRGRKARVN